MKSIYDNPEKMLTKDSYPAFCTLDDACSSTVILSPCDSRHQITICLPDGKEHNIEVGVDCSDEYYTYSWTGDCLKLIPNISTCESSLHIEAEDSYYINVWEEKLDFDRIILENKDCFAVILADIKGYYGLMRKKHQQHWNDEYYTICRGVSMKDQELVFTEPQDNNKFWLFSRQGRIHWNSLSALRKEIEIVKENMVPSKRSDLGVYRILK